MTSSHQPVWKREVFGVFETSEVLPFIGPGRRVYHGDDGTPWLVNMASLRYQTFAKNMSCVVCGLSGTIMRLERDQGAICSPHFNLYANEHGALVLMTKDHIIPRAKGGQNHLSNMQTMCTVCNGLKRDECSSLERLMVLRKSYDRAKAKKSARSAPKCPEYKDLRELDIFCHFEELPT